MLLETYPSPLGDIILCAHEGAVAGLWFSGQKYECAGIDQDLKESEGDRAAIIKLRRWLQDYFSLMRPEIDFPLAPSGTAFQKKVWQALLDIGYGETLSYGELAQRIHCKSARAVGAAVGKNPISILIPCHRVVGAKGTLTGYAGGLERKQYLLSLERQAELSP